MGNFGADGIVGPHAEKEGSYYTIKEVWCPVQLIWNDGGVFPCMQDFLHHLQSKAFQNRTVGIIENGTWGPTAGRTMKGILETMKNITIVEPMVTIRSTMKESDLPAMEALADVIANA